MRNNKKVQIEILKLHDYKTIKPISIDDKSYSYDVHSDNFIKLYEFSKVNYYYDMIKIIYDKIDNDIINNYITENINSSDILLINTFIHDNNINNKKIQDYEKIYNEIKNDNSLFKKIYDGDLKYVIKYFGYNNEDINNINKGLFNILVNVFNKKEIIEKLCIKLQEENVQIEIVENQEDDKVKVIVKEIFEEDNKYLQDYNDKGYKNEINNKYLNKLMCGLHNCYLLNKDNNYFILIILNSDKVKINKKNKYFIYDDNDITGITGNNIYLIKLNYTNLIFEFQNDEELYALYISFVINYNQIGLILINKIVKNIYNKNKTLNNKIKFQEIVGNIIENFDKIDIPFYKDLMNDNYEKININNVKIKLNENNESSYNNIGIISDYITKNKEIFILDENVTNNVDKYKRLIEFAKNFRSKCLIKGGNIENDDIILEKILNNDNKLINIGNIILDRIDYYYNKMIEIKIINITKKLGGNLDKYITDHNLCSDIIKNIEELDKDKILDLTKERTLDIILFEILSGNIVRSEQLEVIKDINQDIIIGKYDKVYEILMGRGKTSTITPLIILNNYIYNKEIEQYNIILPNSLVISSFDIINKLTYVVNDYNIIVNNFSIGKNIINIASDENIKQCIINHIKNNNINIIKQIKESKPLYIFDETDSIINPLKSNLNIPLDQKDHDNKQLIINLLMDIYYNKKEITINDNTEIVDKIKQTEFKVKNMIYNKNFGFGNYGVKSKLILENKNFFISIPYTFIDSPLDGSEFTDYEMGIALTILSYINMKQLRTEDIFLLMYELNIKDIQDDDYLNTNFENNIELIKFIKQKISIFEDDIEMDNKLKYEENINNIKQIITDNIYIKNYEKILYIYIKLILEKFFKISKEQYNISMIDIYNNLITPKKISFSGTINFISPSKKIFDILCNTYNNINLYFSQIYEYINDEKVGPAIEASVYGITTNKPVIEKYMIQDENNKNLSTEEIENNLIEYLKINIKNYNSLIDSGGLILNNKLDDIKKLILENYKECQYILYIDSKHVRYVYDVKTQETFKYNNQIYEKLFIYYDNQHCVGIDFKQPPNMRGLVTINTTSIITDVSQGIYRLRNINVGHYVDFYFPSIKNDEQKIDRYYVYDFLVQNEERNKLQTEIYMIIQCVNNINRFMDNKINVNGFKEKVYYETIKYEDKYLTYKEFMNKKIKNIKNIDIEKVNRYIENIEKKETNEINVQQNVAVQQNISVTKNMESSNIKITYYLNKIVNVLNMINLDNNIDDNKNYKSIIKDIYTIKYGQNEYKYILSSLYYLMNNLYVIDQRKICKIIREGSYFIKNKNKENIIYIITFIDYVNIKYYLDNNNNDDIEIYDNNFNIVYPIKQNLNKLITQNEKLIYGLLITENIIINNQYKKTDNSIIMYIYYNLNSYLQSIKLFEYLQYIIKCEFSFNIDIKITDVNNKKNWELLLNYYNITDDTFKLYLSKYNKLKLL